MIAARLEQGSQYPAENSAAIQRNSTLLPTTSHDYLSKNTSESGARKIVMVGIHLRHADPYDAGVTDDHNEVPCLQSTIARAEMNSATPVRIILFASDREHQVRHWQQAHHFPNKIFVSSNHSSHQQQAFGYFQEHGTRAGVAAVQDLELLSRSHYFVGSRYQNSYTYMKQYCSTFSMLIACLQATNGFQPGRQEMRSVFLDKCDGLKFSRESLPAIHDMTKSLLCTKKSIKEHAILLPSECPNFVNV